LLSPSLSPSLLPSLNHLRVSAAVQAPLLVLSLLVSQVPLSALTLSRADLLSPWPSLPLPLVFSPYQ